MPLAQDISATLNAQTGLDITRVIPISRIPKTTSGKVQRHLMIHAYADGEYTQVLSEVDKLSQGGPQESAQELTDSEDHLKRLCAEILPERNVGPQDNLFEIGTSSVELAQLHEGIEKAFPGTVDITDLFDYPTIRDLAGLLEKKLGGD